MFSFGIDTEINAPLV